MRMGVVMLLCIPLPLALSVGCARFRTDGQAAAPVEQEPSGSSSDARRLADQLQAAKDANAILAARLDEQLARERRLSDQLSKLKFLTRQQQAQIRALADAPGERDALKKDNEKLSAEIVRLKARIAQLTAEIASLKAARQGESGSDAD